MFFSHDFEARADIKLARLLSRHGMQGYGLFWAIIEDLYRLGMHEAMSKDLEFLAWHYRTDQEMIRSVIEDFDLFQFDDEHFWSNTVLNRLEDIHKRSEKARQSAKKRWDKPTGSQPNANAKPTQSEPDAKKSKEKETHSRKKQKVFTPPSKDEVVTYFVDKGFPQSLGEQAFEYYHVSDWVDGRGRKVVNWKQKMISAWMKDELKVKPKVDYLEEIKKHIQ